MREQTGSVGATCRQLGEKTGDLGRAWRGAAMATLATSLIAGMVWGAYKVRQPQLKSPREYAAHQEFQGLVIAAEPFLSNKRIEKELFDTDKILDTGLFPLVLVIENGNDFSVEINLEATQLLSPDDEALTAVPYEDVLFRILKFQRRIRPGYTPLPGNIPQMVERHTDPKMLDDFAEKAPHAKWVDPQTTDFCVVFFERVNDLKGYRVYLPELINADDGSPLVFFEFELP